MARLARLTLGGVLHHVSQSGNNRQSVFVDAADYEAFLAALRESAIQSGVAVHGYVLLDNHVELLVTPKTERGVPTLMQAVGRRYARHFNDRHGRSGALWNGRYRSTLVDARTYLMPCMAYLDLAPVRRGTVERPEDHRWSSHANYIGLRTDPLLTPHPTIWQLGNTPFAREESYANQVRSGLEASRQQRIEHALHGGWPLGSEEFLVELEQSTQRRTRPGRAGRPRRTAVIGTVPD